MSPTETDFGGFAAAWGLLFAMPAGNQIEKHRHDSSDSASNEAFMEIRRMYERHARSRSDDELSRYLNLERCDSEIPWKLERCSDDLESDEFLQGRFIGRRTSFVERYVFVHLVQNWTANFSRVKNKDALFRTHEVHTWKCAVFLKVKFIFSEESSCLRKTGAVLYSRRTSWQGEHDLRRGTPFNRILMPSLIFDDTLAFVVWYKDHEACPLS